MQPFLPSTTRAFAMLALMVVPLATGHAAEGPNLLENPALVPDGGSVPGWKISESSIGDLTAFAAKAEWGAAQDPEGDCLRLATKEPTEVNVWWLQDLKPTGGTTYQIRVDVKGGLDSGSRYGAIVVGLHFLDAQGGWLGFERVPAGEVGDRWMTVEGKITAPAGAATMQLRLGMMCDGLMEVLFRNPFLAEVL
jgi:hypothetical protein